MSRRRTSPPRASEGRPPALRRLAACRRLPAPPRSPRRPHPRRMRSAATFAPARPLVRECTPTYPKLARRSAVAAQVRKNRHVADAGLRLNVIPPNGPRSRSPLGRRDADRQRRRVRPVPPPRDRLVQPRSRHRPGQRRSRSRTSTRPTGRWSPAASCGASTGCGTKMLIEIGVFHLELIPDHGDPATSTEPLPESRDPLRRARPRRRRRDPRRVDRPRVQAPAARGAEEVARTCTARARRRTAGRPAGAEAGSPEGRARRAALPPARRGAAAPRASPASAPSTAPP